MVHRSPTPLILPTPAQLGFSTALALVALLAFGPILKAHPLMDDHLFFAWLEQTPWPEAIWHRLTGNWIPYFNQMQMYRPVSGIVQVLAYQLFGASSLPHHLLNLLLHGLTGLLAGLLTFRLTQSSKAGWYAAGLLLLHPRVAVGVSLMYNFYDPLVACLMMIALLCLWSLKFQSCRRHLWSYLGLWGSVALALGSKELALPLVFVLILADLLWGNSTIQARWFVYRHGIPVVLLAAYLLARTCFVGHPFRTHGHPSTFPLPPDGELWAFFWDGVLLAFCLLGALSIRWLARKKSILPAESSWMLLWCGLMLWPAVHFCSQVTLRPWFFDERYWYVPLVPLSVFAGSFLSQGSLLSSFLGSSLVMLTLPLPLGPLVAVMLFLASGPLQLLHRDEEIQSFVTAFFAATLAVLLWQECGEIRLRADEAATVHRQLARVVHETPAEMPLALLNFTEETVELRLSFNGGLQWLLQPPFFTEDLNGRLLFSYPTWDFPPTNRFRDRTTQELLRQVYQGKPVWVYHWNSKKREFEFVEVSSCPLWVEANTDSPLSMEFHSQADAGPSWSTRVRADPKRYRYVAIKLVVDKPLPLSKELAITLRWFSDRSDPSFSKGQPQWEGTETLRFSSAELGKTTQATPTQVTLWFSPGKYVDWLFSGNVGRVDVTADEAFRVLSVQLFAQLSEGTIRDALHLTHYRHPKTTFQQVGESWWVLGR